MKKTALLLVVIFSTVRFSFANNGGDNPVGKNAEIVLSATVDGTVIDAYSNEALAGVLIEFENANAYSDLAGNFKIEGLKPGVYNVKAKYISYEEAVMQKVEVKAGKDNKLEIKLIADK